MWKAENLVRLRDYLSLDNLQDIDPFREKLFNAPFFIDRRFIDVAKGSGCNIIAMSGYKENNHMKLRVHDPNLK